MKVVLAGLGCVTPEHGIDQQTLSGVAQAYAGGTPTHRRLIGRLFAGTTIRQRASVLLDREPPPIDNGTALPVDDKAEDPVEVLKRFYPGSEAASAPGTGQRMALYERRALPLAARAARSAIADAACAASDITHVIAVSCTGFAAPGLEVRLIEELGLRPRVARTCVGFMGCHAAVNALRLARALVRADPAERVLVVCVELCTLHFQYGDNPQHAVANALFADGAAAAVVKADHDNPGQPALLDTRSEVIAGTADQMGWRIGDHGFEMGLSPQLAPTIESEIAGLTGPWLKGHGLTVADIRGWAIHPGGPRVITAAEQGLGLPPGSGDVSRQVLAAHGNMSSPTVLFIMQRLTRQRVPRPWVVLAFGPGLVVEAMLIG